MKFFSFRKKAKPPISTPRHARLELEALENRCVPAVVSINSIGALRTALLNEVAFANGNPGTTVADTLQLAGGTYSTGGTFLDYPNLPKNIQTTIAAAPGASVVFDGGNASMIMRIVNPNGNTGAKVQFQNITFQNGATNVSGLAGAVQVLSNNVTFSNCVFNNDSVQTNTGGGALNISTNANVVLNSCSFTGNTSTNTGGAIEVQQGSNLTVNSCIFNNNSTNVGGHNTDTEGGAIHGGNQPGQAASTIQLNNTSFNNNVATSGGGAVFVQGVFPGGNVGANPTPEITLLVNNCTFTNNTIVQGSAANFNEGGAVVVEDDALAKFEISRFVNNIAGGGGAIQMFRSTVVVDQCLFAGNSSIDGSVNGQGGAISVLSINSSGVSDPGAVLTLTNSILIGDTNPAGSNSTSAGGSGIDAGGNNTNVVNCSNDIFYNLFALDTSGTGTTGFGGAILAAGTTLNVTGSAFIDCKGLEASGHSNASGGAAAIIGASNATFTNDSFAGCVSVHDGGAIHVQDSVITITGSTFVDNSTGSSQFGPEGGALFLQTTNGSTSGSVSQNLFSNNNGVTIFLGTQTNVNVPFTNNKIFPAAGGSAFQALPGLAESAEQINFAGSSGNTTPSSQPTVVQLFAAPNRLYTLLANGDTNATSDTYVGFIISGPNGLSGTLTGAGSSVGVTGDGILRMTTAGTYTLTSNGVSSSAVTIAQPPLLAVGSDAGAGAYVPVFDAVTGIQVRVFIVYDPFFTGGARVAIGDVLDNGHDEIVVVPGPGGGPDLKVFDGLTGALEPINDTNISNFYSLNFFGGLNLAVGDVLGLGYDQIILGADAGGGPQVKVVDYKNATVLESAFVYDANPNTGIFTGGVRVAVGTINVGGTVEQALFTAPGGGGGSQVRVIDATKLQAPFLDQFGEINLGADGMSGDQLVPPFFALPGFFGGIYIGAGNVFGNGNTEVVVGAGPGTGPGQGTVVVENPSNGQSFTGSTITPYGSTFLGGIRVATGDVEQNGRDAVITGAGPGGGPTVIVTDEVLNGDGSVTQNQVNSFSAFPVTGQTFGLYVAASA